MTSGQAQLPSEHARGTTVIGAACAQSATTDHTSRNSSYMPVSAVEYPDGPVNQSFESQLHSTDGYVEHEAVRYDVQRNAKPSPPSNLEQAKEALSEQDESSMGGNLELTNQRILLEADRVRTKFVSYVDTSTEVILRFDFMNNHDTRVAMFVVYAATFAGFIILLVQFVNIMTKDGSTRRFQHHTACIWNTAVGSVCLLLILAIFTTHAWRVLQAYKQRRVWKPRRKRHTVLFLTETAVQGINLVCYIIPNVFLLCRPSLFPFPVIYWCGWIRWTCWNTLFLLFLVHAYAGRMVKMKPVKMIMDGPWRWLWPCLAPWVAFQTAISLGWLHNAVSGSRRDFANSATAAFQRGVILSSCESDLLTRVCVDVTVGLALVYFAVTCALILMKLSMHKKFSYRMIQMGSVFFRLQFRLRIEVMLFFGLCLVLLWLVKLNSCASQIFVSLGIMPMQIVMTANTFVWSFICMPHTPQDDAAAKRIWEQEFAWTEQDKPIKLAARALTVPATSSLNKQPIFCFATMMKMCYWSCLVYDYKRAARSERRRSKRLTADQVDASKPPTSTQKTILHLHRAMDMYGLTGSELFCELKRDTRCLMGWGNGTIVLAFRGTASVTNALSDLQAWRTAHPPVRGHNMFFNRPLVHVGFLKSWLAGDFNHKVVNRTMEIVHSCKSGANKLKIHITGHSMGGALATLAAYDIRKQLQACGKEEIEVMCYSFGAPRTGNHAFARDYNQVVPDTWSIINDQDVVTRGGKFFFLYKRPGNRVIVNDGGHMIVSPSAIEASVQQSLAGQSVDQHLLSSYQYAIFSVILAQFSRKGFADGMEGIVRVVEAAPKLQEVLETHMDMRLEEMRRLSQLSPEAREGQSLSGAHLPPRGFYQLKSQGQTNKPATREIRCFGLPVWWQLQPSGPNSSASDLQQISVESDLAASSSDEPGVTDVESQEHTAKSAVALRTQGSYSG